MALVEKKLPLELTGLEIVYLTDAVGNGDFAQGLPEKDAYFAVGRAALLLLGSLYTEVVTKDGISDGPGLIYITEEQAWLFRSKVKTGDLAIDGKTNIGIELSLKLYAILLGFNSGLEEVPWETVEEPELTEAQIIKLETFRRENANAPDSASDDASPDESAGAGPREGATDGPGTIMSGPENIHSDQNLSPSPGLIYYED